MIAFFPGSSKKRNTSFRTRAEYTQEQYLFIVYSYYVHRIVFPPLRFDLSYITFNFEIIIRVCEKKIYIYPPPITFIHSRVMIITPRLATRFFFFSIYALL